MNALAQGFTVGERIKFLLVHMLQMEALVVLLGTAIAALVLYRIYKKQNFRQAEQVFTRNLAVVTTSIVAALWLAGRMLR